MVRVGGRDYTAMVESPCYLKGELSCLSCHQMHHPQPVYQGEHYPYGYPAYGADPYAPHYPQNPYAAREEYM